MTFGELVLVHKISYFIESFTNWLV